MKFNGSHFPRICIIGAGFAGLTVALQLKRKLNLNSFVIYEENSDIGGTWLINVYPGVGCDTPSHLYSWSFELNPNWTVKFASGAEILKYMKQVVAKYNLYSHLRLNTQVKRTVWNESTKKWMITSMLKNSMVEETSDFDILITATGLLRTPNYPKEFLSFTGPLIHSARWDSSIDLKNKVVGIVGSGASAVQLIPEIAPIVKQLHCFQRKPAYVLPRTQKHNSRIWNWFCKWFPILMIVTRILTFLRMEFWYPSFKHGSLLNKLSTRKSKSHLEKQVQDPKLRSKLWPKFPYGCNRVLFHDQYYPTLQLPHVKIHTDPILEVSGTKIVCKNGINVELDALILATGFTSNDYKNQLQIIGKNSIDLNEVWSKDKPSLYLSLCTQYTPNHFNVLGPYTELGHTSVLFMAECQANFIVEVIQKMIARNISVISPKKNIEEEYMRELEAKIKKMVWANGNCNAWYGDSKGNITALWPWLCLKYWKRTKKVNLSNFDIS